jgi:hypothetical protein
MTPSEQFLTYSRRRMRMTEIKTTCAAILIGAAFGMLFAIGIIRSW